MDSDWLVDCKGDVTTSKKGEYMKKSINKASLRILYVTLGSVAACCLAGIGLLMPHSMTWGARVMIGGSLAVVIAGMAVYWCFIWIAEYGRDNP